MNVVGVVIGVESATSDSKCLGNQLSLCVQASIVQSLSCSIGPRNCFFCGSKKPHGTMRLFTLRILRYCWV